MQSFADFHSTHFNDPDKRKHFADQIQQSLAQQPQTQAQQEEPLDDWVQWPGESVEQWQIRHGLYHLTPDSVKMFDESRKKREERE